MTRNLSWFRPRMPYVQQRGVLSCCSSPSARRLGELQAFEPRRASAALSLLICLHVLFSTPGTPFYSSRWAPVIGYYYRGARKKGGPGLPPGSSCPFTRSGLLVSVGASVQLPDRLSWWWIVVMFVWVDKSGTGPSRAGLSHGRLW